MFLQTLLVGDAAHTMTPILGQGLNTGLEDSRIFAAILRDTLASGGGVEAALQRYSSERLPDVKALLLINQLVAQERTALLVSNPFSACAGEDPAIHSRRWWQLSAGGYRALIIVYLCNSLGLQLPEL